MIPKIMKFIVIVLLVAVCTQDVLCARKPPQPRKSRTKAEKTALAKNTSAKKGQPITEERASNDASGCTLTIDGASPVKDAIPLSKIPVISVDKEMSIKGENGQISVDGEVLYNKNQVGLNFRKGMLRFKMVNGRCVYLNEKLVAKNLDDNIMLPSKRRRTFNISQFDIKIKLGEYVKMVADRKEANFFWRFPPPKTPAADTLRCPQILDGYSPAESASPVSEIPVLSPDKEVAITYEKGKISVDGVVLYNDEDFKEEEIRFTSTEGKCVYLNEKLVARSLSDDIFFPPVMSNRTNIKKFDIRIKLGDYVKVGVDEAELGNYLTWSQPQSTANASS